MTWNIRFVKPLCQMNRKGFKNFGALSFLKLCSSFIRTLYGHLNATGNQKVATSHVGGVRLCLSHHQAYCSSHTWYMSMEWCWWENNELRAKPVPMPLYLLQIPHGLTWEQTRASVARGRQVTAWAEVWPLKVVTKSVFILKQQLEIQDWCEGKTPTTHCPKLICIKY
jgi:hypothetical protein